MKYAAALRERMMRKMVPSPRSPMEQAFGHAQGLSTHICRGTWSEVSLRSRVNEKDWFGLQWKWTTVKGCSSSAVVQGGEGWVGGQRTEQEQWLLCLNHVQCFLTEVRDRQKFQGVVVVELIAVVSSIRDAAAGVCAVCVVPVYKTHATHWHWWYHLWYYW